MVIDCRRSRQTCKLVNLLQHNFQVQLPLVGHHLLEQVGQFCGQRLNLLIPVETHHLLVLLLCDFFFCRAISTVIWVCITACQDLCQIEGCFSSSVTETQRWYLQIQGDRYCIEKGIDILCEVSRHKRDASDGMKGFASSARVPGRPLPSCTLSQ